MSFDLQNRATMTTQTSLNPFETGQCLSTKKSANLYAGLQKFQSLWNRAMSFDRNISRITLLKIRFNPFGTGQCLSTTKIYDQRHLR